jgi:hypothetical protein
MRDISSHVEGPEMRKKVWGSIYKLLVDAYFERFVIAVSARIGNNKTKEIYNK